MSATDYTNGLIKTQTAGQAWSGDVGIDNVRRTFGIGDKVAELAPQESIFFSYLSKIGKKPIDETVWKPLEYRNQWQRRNFTAVADAAVADTTTGESDDGVDDVVSAGIKITVDYNKHGQQDSAKSYAPIFIVPGQILRIAGVVYKFEGSASDLSYFISTASDTEQASTLAVASTTDGGYLKIPAAKIVKVDDFSTAISSSLAESKGQVIGSQWAEASGAPDGFRDELTNVEFYSQIFKTAVPLMSGSTMATRYRGYANEWKRIYAEHLKTHKMDLENAFLFGYGKYESQDERTSWGLIPFLENKGGKRYQFEYSMTHSNNSATDTKYDVQSKFSYDGMVDVMDDFMAYETGNSGQKLCLTSRKVINALHKVGAGNFLANSMNDAAAKDIFRANLDVKSSSFMPVDITSISTSWGSMNFVAHPLFRGDMEDKAVCVDLSNVSMRPLAGNGISRDTFVETNVQENDVDGRKDMITTEAGLEVLLPETHAVIDFVESDS
tara:strand:+ start:3196 stop:4686 length:1491 start_codon:yes stop_codon:yes gene_type:complete